jgi:hypothetical protein
MIIEETQMDEKQFFDKARQVAKAIDQDEYKVCSLEEAEAFAKKRRKDLREMNTGLFDDIQISNPARDKAWEAFIKRKDVAGWAVDKEGFPLNGFYDVWCIAWSKGWDTTQAMLRHQADYIDQLEKGLESVTEFSKALEAKHKQEFDYVEKLLKERNQ